jgi:hypothetical protein
MPSPIRPYDRESLRKEFRGAKPFPFFKIENFLDPAFLKEVVDGYPTYESARSMGREFEAVNEKLKVQITEREKFPEPIRRLSDLLNGEDFLSDLQYITGIPNLVADSQLAGGGMHLTNTSGRLDVHVDFNYQSHAKLFRRLNILLYLNPTWEEAWGGTIELWDKDVTRCEQSFAPSLNRCVVFETSEISFHGVTPITSPPGVVRKSYAAYYYTKEAPKDWDGTFHSTIFRARPDEKFRGTVLMPAEAAQRSLSNALNLTKKFVKRIIG